MGLIRELDYSTVAKIAAGEVIDRPASIVRELIDNAIDAGADSVRVLVSDGGKGQIEVQDNGCGMDRDDLAVCTKNHSTSKIAAFDDITDLRTLGFRGEALSSAAAVSDLVIRSRRQGSQSGFELTMKNGETGGIRETGINTGTTVIVSELFRNMPARRKFLSGNAAEIKLIDREIIKKALGFPNTGFEFLVEGKRKYLSPKKNTNIEKIADFFSDAVDYLVPLEKTGDGVQVSGYVSKPAFIRPNRMYQYFFVNGRAVEWKNFFFAVQNAYGNLLPTGYFPAVFLYLTVSPALVDFNVHPMKREVRFRNEHRTSQFLQEAIHASLMADTGISSADEGIVSFTPYEQKIGSAISDYLKGAPSSAPREFENNLFQTRPQNEDQPFFPADENITAANMAPLSGYRFKGTVFGTFIILEGENELLFLDQHAVHERINYEKMKDRYKNSLLTPQELLVPVNIDVPREVTDELAEDGIPLLSAMGFEIEHFGGNTFVVRSAPEYLDYRDVGATVMGFVETLEENPDTHAVDFIDRAIKQMACKSSVRSGDGLSKEEVEKLLEDWEKTPDRFSCPHGRPVAFFLSRKDIEKQFKRLGF